MTPASSARRLLLGTGLGLFLAGGFGLISGVITIETPNIGFLVPLIGLILICLSYPTASGEGPLANWFPTKIMRRWLSELRPIARSMMLMLEMLGLNWNIRCCLRN